MRKILRLFMVLAATGLVAAPAAAASDACAPMTRLIHQARNDFASLKTLRMQPGVCTLRGAGYQCRWAFPGDAFAVAETQTAGLVQCAVATTGSTPQKLKRGETAIALESDLSLVVAEPMLDSGQWLVTLRIVSAAPRAD